MIYCMRTRIFFSVNNTDYLLVTNYRIIEFQSHGVSRTVTDFFFTRNIADRHGFSFLSRIRELSNFCLPWPSAILRVIDRNNSQIRDKKDYSVWKAPRDALLGHLTGQHWLYAHCIFKPHTEEAVINDVAVWLLICCLLRSVAKMLRVLISIYKEWILQTVCHTRG